MYNCSIEELKEWLKRQAEFHSKESNCSIEELKEWLKLCSGLCRQKAHCSIEELKEWLKLEHFSGLFSHYFGAFPFDSVFADSTDQVRALEIAGYTGLILSGAFVMCYLLNLFLESKKTLLARFGGNATFISGIMACSSNVLVGYPLLAQMTSTTRIKVIAFSVCGGFLLGDHLSFSANFQPSLIVAVSIGKIVGGILSIYLARFFVARNK